MNCLQWLSPADQFRLLPQPTYQLYYHYPSNSTVQSILTRILSRDYERSYDVAQWRYKTQHPIVKVYHGRFQKETRQGVYVHVFVQKIQRLLYEMEQITITQALYLLRTSLIALQRLSQKFGYFHLTDKMIGINRNNQCKVWINQNFHKFHVLRKQFKQQTMVERLFELVEKHTQQSDQNKNFFIQASYQCCTFIKALNFINIYAYQQEFVIPPLFLQQDRRLSLQSQKINKTNVINSQYQSYINNQNLLKSGKLNKKEVRTQRKIDNIFVSNLQPRNSAQISFNSTNNWRNINKNPNSALKESKYTTAPSSENASKKNNVCIDLFSKFPKQSSMSIIHHHSNYHQISEQQNKKMTIMSTINLTIEGNRKMGSLKQTKSDERAQYTSQMMKKLFHDGFQKNEWKKTVSHLFSSDKNLKESMSYGEEQKLYLRDINLKKLGQFGRFIKTSLLQRNEEQESQVISQFIQTQQ